MWMICIHGLFQEKLKQNDIGSEKKNVKETFDPPHILYPIDDPHITFFYINILQFIVSVITIKALYKIYYD